MSVDVPKKRSEEETKRIRLTIAKERKLDVAAWLEVDIRSLDHLEDDELIMLTESMFSINSATVVVAKFLGQRLVTTRMDLEAYQYPDSERG